MLSKTALFSMAALGVLLAGCSDEPSEADMRTAVSSFIFRTYQQQIEAAAYLIGPRPKIPPMPVITTFRKLGCVPAQPEVGFRCEFELGDGQRSGPGRGRFFRAADGTFQAVE